jgi:hypothetical protein
VRLRPMAVVWLERAHTFHVFTPDDEPTILATGPKGVNRTGLCYSPRPSGRSRGRPKAVHVWSLPKVFHTCGKSCGKSRESMANI